MIKKALDQYEHQIALMLISVPMIVSVAAGMEKQKKSLM